MKTLRTLVVSTIFAFLAFTNVNALTLNPGDSVDVSQSDDGFTDLDFVGYEFSFFGTAYTSMVFNNSNGNITFGSSSGDFSPTVSEFLNGPPRIAGLWQDLNPQDGGTITLSLDADASNFRASFTDINAFGVADSPNTFEMVLNRNGNITFNYDLIDPRLGTFSTDRWIIGVTPGGGAPATDVGAFTPGATLSLFGNRGWYASYEGEANAPTELEGGSIRFTRFTVFREVPTLGTYGLLLLGGLLLGFALLTFRRRGNTIA